MPLSEVQRRTPPFARGTPWREWWTKQGHKPVTAEEMRAWVAKVEREQGETKAQLQQRRDEAKEARKR